MSGGPGQAHRPRWRRAAGAVSTALRRRSLIWLVPLAALLVGGYLAATTLAQRGPEVTVTFDAATGIGVGAKVQHKAVELGTVAAIHLTADTNHVDATLRMRRDAEPYLTDQARFWVVRAQFSGGAVSGLNTLVSGSYIEMDPGTRAGAQQDRFTALPSPPGKRSDEPGTTYVVHAPSVTWLTTGTPVFYRDVVVGEVLGHDVPEGSGEATGEVFVRAPYDQRVRTGTVWWQTRGISTVWEPNGLRVNISSMRAVAAGGLAFNVPPYAPAYPLAPAGTTYPLFGDEAAANRASQRARISFVIHLDSPVPGLAAGSPVLLYGRQVGDVRELSLRSDLRTGTSHVRGVVDLLPGSLTMTGQGEVPDSATIGRRLVAGGMRAEVLTTGYIAGTQAVSLAFPPNPSPVAPAMEDGLTVLPATEGGGGIGVASGAGLLAQVQAMPFQTIGNGLAGVLGTVEAVLGGFNPGVQTQAASAMLQRVRDAVAQADASVGPMLRTLPDTADSVQRQLRQVNQALATADASYGRGSGLEDTVGRMLARYYDTVRYVRLTADYLTRHPEAIARGTTGQGVERN